MIPGRKGTQAKQSIDLRGYQVSTEIEEIVEIVDNRMNTQKSLSLID
jgi:hypothetical protein